MNKNKSITNGNSITNDEYSITNDEYSITNTKIDKAQFVIRNSRVPKFRFKEFVEDGEWKKKALGDDDVSIIIMGASPKSSYYNKNKIGLPLLQGNADIKNRFSSPRIYTSQVTKECQINDILLSVRAPVGTVAKSLHKACIGRGISAIRAIKNNSQVYLYQWLISFEPYWKNISQGGTFDAVNSDDIRRLKIPLPNPKEQQKIANTLSSLDDYIKAETEKLSLLKDHKKGLLQQLFPTKDETVPKKRFPEFVNDGEWEEKMLGDDDVSIIIMGASPKSSYYNKNKIGLPLLQGNADIKNRFSSPRIYTSQVTKECQINDILLSVRAPVGTVAKSLHKACIGRGISAIRAVKKNSQEYLYQWLISFEPYWKNISQGGTFDAVNSDDIRRLKIPLPNPKEQQKIATTLTAVDELIEAQTIKIDRLQNHKKGLMQGLFPNINNVAL